MKSSTNVTMDMQNFDEQSNENLKKISTVRLIFVLMHMMNKL